MNTSSIFELALTFFFVTNPVGNLPAMLTLVKNLDFHRQRFVLIREALIAFVIALFFQYFGKFFLDMLHIQTYAVTIAGGILLAYIAMGMIFPFTHSTENSQTKQEPLIVPIAMPLISGPGFLAILMINSSLYNDNVTITLALTVTWIGIVSVLAMGPYLNKILGRKGLVVMEQIMGMILLLISFQMLVVGSKEFILSSQKQEVKMDT